MKDIIYLALLGIFAGGIAAFWTRIIRKGMILFCVGEWLWERDYKKLLTSGDTSRSAIAKFLNCIFCLSPWIYLPLFIWYVIEYSPGFFPVLIGLLAGLGLATFISETVYYMRNGV